VYGVLFNYSLLFLGGLSVQRKKDIDWYVKAYLAARKWLDQCVACQFVGYKPDLPEHINGSVLAENLRRYFHPIHLNEQGLCDACASLRNCGNS
jgi:hypothetical protein